MSAEEEIYRQKLIDIHDFLDKSFNGEATGKDRKTGFVLLVFPFNGAGPINGRLHYLSNGANRNDVVDLFEYQKRIFLANPEVTPL